MLNYLGLWLYSLTIKP